MPRNNLFFLFPSVLKLSGQYELQTIGNENLEDFTVYLEYGMFKYSNDSQILTIHCLFFCQLLLKNPFRVSCGNFWETKLIQIKVHSSTTINHDYFGILFGILDIIWHLGLLNAYLLFEPNCRMDFWSPIHLLILLE